MMPTQAALAGKCCRFASCIGGKMLPVSAAWGGKLCRYGQELPEFWILAERSAQSQEGGGAVLRFFFFHRPPPTKADSGWKRKSGTNK